MNSFNIDLNLNFSPFSVAKSFINASPKHNWIDSTVVNSRIMAWLGSSLSPALTFFVATKIFVDLISSFKVPTARMKIYWKREERRIASIYLIAKSNWLWWRPIWLIYCQFCRLLFFRALQAITRNCFERFVWPECCLLSAILFYWQHMKCEICEKILSFRLVFIWSFFLSAKHVLFYLLWNFLLHVQLGQRSYPALSIKLIIINVRSDMIALKCSHPHANFSLIWFTIKKSS